MMTMERYEYNDGRRPAGRFPKLYLVKADKAAKFRGSNIPGFCAITAQKYVKQGKWSNTTYQLALAPGVIPVYLLSPLHGVFGQNFPSWEEAAREMDVPTEVAKAIIRAEYPTTAERLDELEEFFTAAEVVIEPKELINLTPHVVRIFRDDAVVKEIPPSGTVARVKVSRETVGNIDGVPINRAAFGAVENLPLQEGVVFIVSLMVAQAAKDRSDLLSPDDLVRDESGQIKGCRAFARP